MLLVRYYVGEMSFVICIIEVCVCVILYYLLFPCNFLEEGFRRFFLIQNMSIGFAPVCCAISCTLQLIRFDVPLAGGHYVGNLLKKEENADMIKENISTVLSRTTK